MQFKHDNPRYQAPGTWDLTNISVVWEQTWGACWQDSPPAYHSQAYHLLLEWWRGLCLKKRLSFHSNKVSFVKRCPKNCQRTGKESELEKNHAGIKSRSIILSYVNCCAEVSICGNLLYPLSFHLWLNTRTNTIQKNERIAIRSWCRCMV